MINSLKSASRSRLLNLTLALGTATIIAGTAASPAKAQTTGLQSAIENINTTMTALEGIAETGVAIVVVPFGIGFALKIAGHVLRAGT